MSYDTDKNRKSREEADAGTGSWWGGLAAGGAALLGAAAVGYGISKATSSSNDPSPLETREATAQWQQVNSGSWPNGGRGMRPSDIYHIQDKVGNTFQSGQDLLETFEELVNGSLDPNEISLIEVVPYKEKYFAFDGNRRLLLYKKLEEANLLSCIAVKVKERSEASVMMKYSTKDGGRTIKVRGEPDFENNMNRILMRYGKL